MAIFYSVGATAFPRNPMYTVGKQLRKVNYKETYATTGTIGDQHVWAGPLSIDARISRILTQRMAALTSATDNDLGFFYKKADGTFAVVKASGGNELWDGVSLASAVTTYLDVLTNKNSGLDNTKSIRDLLSYGPEQEPMGGIYLIHTVNVAQSAGGVVDLDIEIEEATTR
jgi:hypothetical protein